MRQVSARKCFWKSPTLRRGHLFNTAELVPMHLQIFPWGPTSLPLILVRSSNGFRTWVLFSCDHSSAHCMKTGLSQCFNLTRAVSWSTPRSLLVPCDSPHPMTLAKSQFLCGQGWLADWWKVGWTKGGHVSSQHQFQHQFCTSSTSVLVGVPFSPGPGWARA